MNRYKKNQLYSGYTEEELFQNEEEKAKVENMAERDREMFFGERVSQLNKEKERRKILEEPGDQKNKKESKDKDEDMNSGSESGEIAGDDDKNRRSPSQSAASSLSSDDENSHRHEATISLSLSEVEKAKISRQFCERFYEIPIFDDKIKKAFVKFNYDQRKSGNSGYVLGQVKEVVIRKEKPYNFTGKQCDKYFLVILPEKEITITMTVISNSSINEDEFNYFKGFMENKKIPLPKNEELTQIALALNEIRNFKYSKSEWNEMVAKNIEKKIMEHSKNINVTYHLDVLKVKRNSTLEEYEEEKDEKKKAHYKEILDSTDKQIEALIQIKEEREKLEMLRAQKDVVSQINKKKIEKQRLEDLKNSYLSKKKQREESDIYNPYKRKHCLPTNLYDNGYLKEEKKVESPKKEEEEKPKTPKKEEEKPHKKEEKIQFNYGVTLFKKMKEIQNKIVEKGSMFEEMMKNDQKINQIKRENKNNEGYKFDLDLFFDLVDLDKKAFYKSVEEHNKYVLQNEKAKKITLDQV